MHNDQNNAAKRLTDFASAFVKFRCRNSADSSAAAAGNCTEVENSGVELVSAEAKEGDETPSSFYGSHMLPLNGYSEQLDRFGEDDGVPVIAMHKHGSPRCLVDMNSRHYPLIEFNA